jgi:hypothetical protein
VALADFEVFLGDGLRLRDGQFLAESAAARWMGLTNLCQEADAGSCVRPASGDGTLLLLQLAAFRPASTNSSWRR